jgi:hypothetical protein
MDLPIDTALALIYVIYKSAETYNTNGDQLLLLVEKIRQFEVPLCKLRTAVILDDSMEFHIQKLNDLLVEVRDFIDEYQNKGRVRRLLGALFTDESIRNFHERVEEIKRDMNFELDLNNHIIFHSFNSIGRDMTRNFEHTLSELRTIKLDETMSFLKNYLQTQVSILRYDMEIHIDKKIHELGQTKTQLTSNGHRENGDFSKQHFCKGSTRDLYRDKAEKDQIPFQCMNVDGNARSSVIDFCKRVFLHQSIVHKENIVLRKHFDMILLILLLQPFKGHIIYDGNTISKRLSFQPSDTEASICTLNVRLPLIKKSFKVSMKNDHVRDFLYRSGFCYYTATLSKGLDVVPFELASFYHENRDFFYCGLT